MQNKQQFNNVTDMLSLQEDGKMDCEESKPPCLVEVKQEQFEDISESETKMDNEEMGKQEPLQFRDDEVFPKTEERPARSCNSRYAFRHILGASTKPSRPTVRKTVVLWKFLEELLDTNENNCVVWVSREEGTFKFVDSKLAAKLWGQKKNKRNMTYEKLSRALRYYYDRQIMFHEEGQKLIYRFGDIVMKNRKPSVAEAS
ncbi:ETS- transcription factor Elf-2 [Desmophyllum pertusum]|uniref:ETS- transcription factor Elf-2 n=1 Tax=Desmophyllum pertusum TaxID=174260 RepID=A0A9W9YDK2_9CNID|nr:ETS- transcription factor Elf-2 [Desmophyllum pertusum]